MKHPDTFASNVGKSKRSIFVFTACTIQAGCFVPNVRKSTNAAKKPYCHL
jgi:hypothetical protein